MRRTSLACQRPAHTAHPNKGVVPGNLETSSRYMLGRGSGRQIIGGFHCSSMLLLAMCGWMFCAHECSAFVHTITSPRPLLLLRGGGKVRAGTAPSAFKFQVITISQTKEKWCEDACKEYASRIKKFGVGLDEVTLKPAVGPPRQTDEQQKEEEGKSLLSRVDISRDRLVLLDERGDLMTSHEFAEYIQRCADDGDRSLTFAIGGASGHSEHVRNTARKAGRMLSLGKMVMNHQIARVVLLEQIYRALTIQRGIPYHK